MNSIISINLGLPRDVSWRGRTVRTAIWKRPAKGKVFASRLNLVGDAQADLSGHGGQQRAVMVYQLASYRYWETFLRRAELEYGSFGENFTVEGLADDDVCIGDRFQIGTARFEVSQPRVTCYKVGLRLDHAEMPSLLVSHRRPGFYFRVIQEGEVQAGDRINKVADGPERMTVAEIDALLYSADHPAKALRRALRIPALSPGWQQSMGALLGSADKGGQIGNAGLSPKLISPVAWIGFKPLKVISISQESVDVLSFELAPLDDSSLPTASPGQHVVVRLRPNADAPPVMRTYSLCGAPGAETYTIAVKNEDGPASGFLHRHIQVGDVLDTSAPRGSFILSQSDSPIVLLSAGIGITPLLAMLHAAARDAHQSREVWWFHAARDSGRHSFPRQVRGLMRALRRGHLCTVYSQPDPADQAGVDYDIHGRLTADLLRQMGVSKESDFYLCGPIGFLTDLTKGLKAWQIDQSKIHTEVFGASGTIGPGIADGPHRKPHLPPDLHGGGPMVTFLRSGISVRWSNRFGSLLELAEACSVPVRWSCRSGVCHNCESSIIDGRIEYSVEPLDPPLEHTALVCCATPATDLALDL